MCNRGGFTMLLEFSCSNHKSIKDKVTFSALAGTDDTFQERLFSFGKYKILKSAVIYGANGSGKSNFIDAIMYVKRLVLNSISHQPGTMIHQLPHKLLGENEKSEYYMQFIKNNIRYVYSFSLCKNEVSGEYLYYFPNGRAVKIFERENNSYASGDKFKRKFDTCKDVIAPNRLFLSCAANFSQVDVVKDVFSFFKDDMIFYGKKTNENWLEKSLTSIKKNPAVKKQVINFANALGVNIQDIRIEIKKQDLKNDNFLSILSEELKTRIIDSYSERLDAYIVYDTFETNLLSEESDGVKKIFEFACPLMDIIENHRILFCDELEINFHEALIYNIIKTFADLEDTFPAQLFFTTHNTSILDLSLFRRDQIWFTELKEEDRSTDLYSLAEIKNVRKDDNIHRGYINGKYGAIPMLNNNLAKLFTERKKE